MAGRRTNTIKPKVQQDWIVHPKCALLAFFSIPVIHLKEIPVNHQAEQSLHLAPNVDGLGRLRAVRIFLQAHEKANTSNRPKVLCLSRFEITRRNNRSHIVPFFSHKRPYPLSWSCVAISVCCDTYSANHQLNCEEGKRKTHPTRFTPIAQHLFWKKRTKIL